VRQAGTGEGAATGAVGGVAGSHEAQVRSRQRAEACAAAWGALGAGRRWPWPTPLAATDTARGMVCPS